MFCAFVLFLLWYIAVTFLFLYNLTDYWYPEHERCIRWDDATLAINWRLDTAPSLSAKDAAGKLLADAELFD